MSSIGFFGSGGVGLATPNLWSAPQTFGAAPPSGGGSIQIGTGLFGGGATPNFQGSAPLAVNMAAGYASTLADLQIAGVSKFSVNNFGQVNAAQFIASGFFFGPNFGASGGSQFTAGFQQPCVFTTSGAGTIVVVTRGIALQTGDLLQLQDSGSVNQLGMMNAGTGASPVWALRVAPVANAASMAQAHVGGASTGKAIQVLDNTGTSLGWLQLLA